MSFAGPREPDPFDGAVRRAPEGPPPGEQVWPPAEQQPSVHRSGAAPGPHEHAPGRHRFAYAIVGLLLAASLVCVGLIAARSWYSHTYHYWFLLWNLVLAWVPFIFAAIAYRLASARRAVLYVLILAAAVVWLAFFPNAPYILTDFLHLGSMGDIVPGWYDVLMLYWFAWTGLILGIVSLYLMQEIVSHGLGMTAGWVFVVVAAGLGSFGIYLRPVPALEQLGHREPAGAARGRVARPRHRPGLATGRWASPALRLSVPLHLRGDLHLRQAHQAAPGGAAGLTGGPAPRAAPPGGALPALLHDAYTPAMTPGNIPRLIETLKAHAGDDKHIACEDAFKIAHDLDVPLADVGRTCNSTWASK